MAFTDPARMANEQQALHPHYSDYNGPPPPKRKPIRNLIKFITGKKEKKDRTPGSTT
jgi:hypothetical protein